MNRPWPFVRPILVAASVVAVVGLAWKVASAQRDPPSARTTAPQPTAPLTVGPAGGLQVHAPTIRVETKCARGRVQIMTVCEQGFPCTTVNSSCYPYVCAGNAQAGGCLDRCTRDSDCVDSPNTYCDATGNCRDNDWACDGDHTLTRHGGSFDCAPYKCAANQCLAHCGSRLDCMNAGACSAAGDCIP